MKELNENVQTVKIEGDTYKLYTRHTELSDAKEMRQRLLEQGYKAEIVKRNFEPHLKYGVYTLYR